MNKIEVRNLTKEFKSYTALKNINHTFVSGKIYALVGRNGSGKSVLLKCISGLLKASKGEVLFNGLQVGKDIDFIYNAGILIDGPGLLLDYSAYKNLKYISSINNIIDDNRIREILKEVSLDPDLKTSKDLFYGHETKASYSYGSSWRAGHYFLDEIFNGLDDKSVEKIREIVKNYKNEDRIIFITSHNKDDISYLADEIIRLDRGEIKEVIENV